MPQSGPIIILESLMKQIELLAPAGSYESLIAACRAGADAVYTGGRKFSARAYADNLSREELLDAIDFTHFHNKKLYLAINTLLKSRELEQELYGYLAPLYEAGLDGVILQDVGVLSRVRDWFPGLALHASTQMTVTGIDGAAFLKAHGVRRIVPARELSIAELAAIKDATGLELEVFIHGALCYSYSGMCLFSSLLGGRSGNRGRCAQPCRLLYRLDQGDPRYYLSPKDLCGLAHIPALWKAGADSLKIEGRMKNPLYTAGVVSVYRHYLDLYASQPESYRVDQADLDFLLDLYNRGETTDGYFTRRNSGTMISALRANHFGLRVGKARPGKQLPGGGRTVCAVFSRDVSRGDVLELRDAGQKILGEYTIQESRKKGQKISLSLQKGKLPAGELDLYRTKNAGIEKELEKRTGGPLARTLEGRVELSSGKPARFTLWDSKVSVTVEGEQVQEAVNCPLEQKAVIQRMAKTGGTEFQFSKITCETDGSVFLPNQSVNELRRLGLRRFQKEVLSGFRRKLPEKTDARVTGPNFGEAEVHGADRDGSADSYRYIASVETADQLDWAAKSRRISRIDWDERIFPLGSDGFFQDLPAIYEALHKKEILLYHRLPAVFRGDTRARYEKWFPALLNCSDGFIVRNTDEYAYLVEKKRKQSFWQELIGDFTLYTWQSAAAAFWKEHPCRLTAPVELNEKELLNNKGCYEELIIYGRYPMMVSAGCLEKTRHVLEGGSDSCKKSQNMLYLTDRYGKKFPVRQFCRDCGNVIYNSLPLSLGENEQEIRRLGIRDLRFLFTTESGRETARIIENMTEAFDRKGRFCLPADSYTRGHFKRGVE